MKTLLIAAFISVIGFISCHKFNYKVHSYVNRRKCRYWQQSGCFLDVLEKICSPEQPIKTVIASELNPDKSEDLFLCCCPLPYKRCKISEMDSHCYAHLKKHFPYKYINRISQADVVNGVQQVRAALLSHDSNCLRYLAPISPLSACRTMNPAPLQRVDLICEMLLWQWEELGDGDKKEFHHINCPFIISHKAKNGSSRKSDEADDSSSDHITNDVLRKYFADMKRRRVSQKLREYEEMRDFKNYLLH